jgi:2'-5' RNA ligase
MATQRLFLAVRPSPEILKGLVSLQQDVKVAELLAEAGASSRWLPQESLHLTLHFLGEFPIEKREKLIDELEIVTDLIRPRRQVLDQWLAFPDVKRARVAGVGAFNPSVELADFYRQIAAVIEGFDIPMEHQFFQPHISLVRFRAPLHFALGLPLLSEPLVLNISSVVLYQSHLGIGGSAYEQVAEFPLAGG